MSFFAISTDSLFASLRDYATLAAQMLGGEMRVKAMIDGIIGKLGVLSNLRPRCGQFRTKLPFFGTGYNPNDFGANLQQHPARVTPESLREFLIVKQRLAIPLKEFLMGIASHELVHEHIYNYRHTRRNCERVRRRNREDYDDVATNARRLHAQCSTCVHQPGHGCGGQGKMNGRRLIKIFLIQDSSTGVHARH